MQIFSQEKLPTSFNTQTFKVLLVIVNYSIVLKLFNLDRLPLPSGFLIRMQNNYIDSK